MSNTIKDLILIATPKIKSQLEEIEQKYEDTKVKHSQVDKFIVDLLHDIELNKLDAVGMTKKYKELQGILRLRRKYKDDIELLTEFRNKISLKQVTRGEINVNKLLTSKENRQYTNRLKDEVKQELLKEIENI